MTFVPYVHDGGLNSFIAAVNPQISIEITHDGSSRVYFNEICVASLCLNNLASFAHKNGTIYQHDNYIYSVLRSDHEEKIVVFCDETLLFSCKNLRDASVNAFFFDKNGSVFPISRRLCAPLEHDLAAQNFQQSRDHPIMDLQHYQHYPTFEINDIQDQVCIFGVKIVYDRKKKLRISSNGTEFQLNHQTQVMTYHSAFLFFTADVDEVKIISGDKEVKACNDQVIIKHERSEILLENKVKKFCQGAQMEQPMEPLNQMSWNPQSNDVEADFKPLFSRNHDKYRDIKLHYVDLGKRDNLKVLCSLESFQWKKIKCEHGEKHGHYFAHFILPKNFDKRIEFKFIVNNEYMLVPENESNKYDIVVTHDGYINNSADLKNFPIFDPESIEWVPKTANDNI